MFLKLMVSCWSFRQNNFFTIHTKGRAGAAHGCYSVYERKGPGLLPPTGLRGTQSNSSVPEMWQALWTNSVWLGEAPAHFCIKVKISSKVKIMSDSNLWLWTCSDCKEVQFRQTWTTLPHVFQFVIVCEVCFVSFWRARSQILFYMYKNSMQ